MIIKMGGSETRTGLHVRPQVDKKRAMISVGGGVEIRLGGDGAKETPKNAPLQRPTRRSIVRFKP